MRRGLGQLPPNLKETADSGEKWLLQGYFKMGVNKQLHVFCVGVEKQLLCTFPNEDNMKMLTHASNSVAHTQGNLQYVKILTLSFMVHQLMRSKTP